MMAGVGGAAERADAFAGLEVALFAAHAASGALVAEITSRTDCSKRRRRWVWRKKERKNGQTRASQ
ncbi:unnamed protein product [Protopolystoma xenopodis]|uniref:Uncharacterized protein n=1 Tax=Protopolystoma xenopodis TaxID=117903 RepID=A0A3S5CVD2_9PLAT|nr:unnamed protein product [Protopolystoma xenopodis]